MMGTVARWTPEQWAHYKQMLTFSYNNIGDVIRKRQAAIKRYKAAPNQTQGVKDRITLLEAVEEIARSQVW